MGLQDSWDKSEVASKNWKPLSDASEGHYEDCGGHQNQGNHVS